MSDNSTQQIQAELTSLEKQLSSFVRKSEKDSAVIQLDIVYIKQSVLDIKKMIGDKYVTRDEFDPIKRIVYGMVSLVLVSFVGAVLALIINT